ncbi:winged helix-turn-helix domain-containing protein [Streptomyces sp. NWU49]|uniref:helix-turn-helix domain-containing protein n=1 Tax=Streptomyces sp. NWU49 TaxID=2201153 RepID=UPI0035C0C0AB
MVVARSLDRVRGLGARGHGEHPIGLSHFARGLHRPHADVGYDGLFAVLERELAKGPIAHGRPDQTWTLARIKTLIGRRFHESHTVQGVAALLRRHGWTCQVPARRAIERDEAAVAGWAMETWPRVGEPWRRSKPGSSSRTRPASR